MVRTLALTLPAIAALAACTPEAASTAPRSADTQKIGMANPASVYCVQKGGTLAIRTAADGSQSGWCHLPDGRVADEWELFRAETK